VVRLEKIADLADAFVRVRLVRITGVDLNLFDFDHDLTWAAFLMNANQKVYGRYGGRDARDPDARISLDGLRYALRAALDAHAREPKDAPPRRTGKPLLAESFPLTKGMRRGECIHCHQLNEIRRAHRKALGEWKRADLWVYPLPENVGITLDVAEGNRVRKVAPGSPAEKAGLRPGDFVRTLNGYPVASLADPPYARNNAPARGPIAMKWSRGNQGTGGELEFAHRWG
jgi:hypothetical protein